MKFFNSALEAWTISVPGKGGRDLDLCARKTLPSDDELRLYSSMCTRQTKLCAFIVLGDAEAAEMRTVSRGSITVIGQKGFEPTAYDEPGTTSRSISTIIDIAKGLLGFEFSSPEDEQSIKARIEEEANGLLNIDPGQVRKLNEEFDKWLVDVGRKLDDEKKIFGYDLNNFFGNIIMYGK